MADIDVVAVLCRFLDSRDNLAEAILAIAAVSELMAAAGPFVVTNSGDEHTTITVKSDDIRRLRHALNACKPATK